MRANNSKFKIPYDIPVFYADNKNIMPESDKPFIAFAGIGYPQKFFNNLKGRIIMTKNFPDHHQYTDVDLNKLFKLAKSKKADLVTTEKDWVRLPAAVQKKIKYAPLETNIEPKFWEWLNENI
jgi:tetraacyldisaccharide 4'-kinase